MLEARLADRELVLANLRGELAGFEGRYLREVGSLYAELDDWNAKLAEITAELFGNEESRTVAAEAREQARESFAAAHGESARMTEFKPEPELKKLFREACNRVHPDRASTEEDRKLRERLMAYANVAYKRQDGLALRRVIEEYANRPEAVVGSGIKEELQRAARQIDRITRRLGEIEAELAALGASEIAKLMARVEAAAVRGRVLLDDMARGLHMRIDELREEYDQRSAGLRMK